MSLFPYRQDLDGQYPGNQGWTPRPAPRCGEGGVLPAPPRPVKMIKTAGQVAGQNKGPNLSFMQ